MGIALNIDINSSNIQDAPAITVSELKEKIQAYVNTLRVRVIMPDNTNDVSTVHHHSLSSLRGVCQSNIADAQAMEEYISEKY